MSWRTQVYSVPLGGARPQGAQFGGRGRCIDLRAEQQHQQSSDDTRRGRGAMHGGVCDWRFRLIRRCTSLRAHRHAQSVADPRAAAESAAQSSLSEWPAML